MYTTMHGSVGMLFAAVLIKMGVKNPYLYLIPLGFCSHFLCDLYPEFYPRGGWYRREKTWLRRAYNLIVNYYPLWLALCVVLALQIGTLTRVEGVVFLIWGFVLANLVDLTEAIYKIVFGRAKSFWFCHNGFFPLRVKRWQRGRMGLWQAIGWELGLNFLTISLIWLLLRS